MQNKLVKGDNKMSLIQMFDKGGSRKSLKSRRRVLIAFDFIKSLQVMKKWYLRLSGGNPNNPEHYLYVGSGPPNCPGSGKICCILACDDGSGKPLITTDLQSEMIMALNSGLNQPEVLLRFNN